MAYVKEVIAINISNSGCLITNKVVFSILYIALSAVSLDSLVWGCGTTSITNLRCIYTQIKTYIPIHKSVVKNMINL